jgi:hypothetical protein
LGVNNTGAIQGKISKEEEEKNIENCISPVINNQKYFIILTASHKPTFIRVKDGITYHLSTYETISCKELMIDKEKFRMAIRNHLGKLVITFSGYEDKPWIIQNIQLSEDDYAGLITPKDQISIWGGNIQSGFIFGPIQYEEKCQIALPSGHKVHKQDFELPKNKDDKYVYTMSNGRIGESGLESPIRSDVIKGPPTKNGNYIYSCDAQCIFESRSVFKGDNEYVEDVEKKIFKDSYFLGIDNLFIKECQGDCPLDASGKIKIKKDSNRKSAISLVQNPTWIFSTSHDGSDAKKFDVLRFWLSVNLVSGCHTFDSGFYLKNCKTPVISQITCWNVANEEDLWTPFTNGLDISHRVENFSDSWSSSDYTKIEHSGSMTVLLHDSSELTKLDKRANSGQTNVLATLNSLMKRAFYFTVDVVYKSCFNSNSSTNKIYTKLPYTYVRMFTGICTKSSLEESSGSKRLNCSLSDYSEVLLNSYIFNSPFFDGMRDINAVYELAKMSSMKTFRQNSRASKSFPAPLEIITKAAASSLETVRLPTLDGRIAVMDTYALPQSYDRLNNAYFRFKDGDEIWNALTSISTKSGKVLFFDTYGQLRYENRKFDEILFGDSRKNITPDWYYTSIPTNGGTDGQLIFEKLTREWDVKSVYNDIHLITSTPNFELLIGHDCNYDGIVAGGRISKPEGWLGFRKTLFQQDGIFGSLDALKKQIKHLTRSYSPPRIVKFESFGQPVRALDVVSIKLKDNLQGQSIIVTSVSNSIVASENKWWQNVEGEWIGPTKEVQFKGNIQSPAPNNNAVGDDGPIEGAENAGDALVPNAFDEGGIA